jgi:hypothetical protein
MVAEAFEHDTTPSIPELLFVRRAGRRGGAAPGRSQGVADGGVLELNCGLTERASHFSPYLIERGARAMLDVVAGAGQSIRPP